LGETNREVVTKKSVGGGDLGIRWVILWAGRGDLHGRSKKQRGIIDVRTKGWGDFIEVRSILVQGGKDCLAKKMGCRMKKVKEKSKKTLTSSLSKKRVKLSPPAGRG